MQLYTVGKDAFSDWQTAPPGTFKVLLLQNYTFTFANQFVVDLDPATWEVTASGYSRVDLTNLVRNVNLSNNTVEFSADPIDFGSLAPGQTVSGVVVYRFITDDTDSPLIGGQDFSSLPNTGNPDPFVVAFPSNQMFLAV